MSARMPQAARREYTAWDVGDMYLHGVYHGWIGGCIVTSLVLIAGIVIVRLVGGAL